MATPTFGKPVKEMTEDEIQNTIDRSYPTEVVPLSVELLTRRIKDLKDSIDIFRDSSDKYSRKICLLTWVLIGLTLILAIPVLNEIFHYYS